MSKKPTIEETAYHEAGHAVANIALGLHTTRVSIVNEGGDFGRCFSPGSAGYHFKNQREFRRIGRDQIVATYAGWEAEVRYSPDANQEWSQRDFDSVIEHSRECAVFPRSCKNAGDEAHMKFLRRLQLEAKKLVRDHWAKIEIVAKALLERNELTGAEVEKLIESVEPDRTTH